MNAPRRETESLRVELVRWVRDQLRAGTIDSLKSMLLLNSRPPGLAGMASSWDWWQSKSPEDQAEALALVGQGIDLALFSFLVALDGAGGPAFDVVLYGGREPDDLFALSGDDFSEDLHELYMREDL